MEKLHELVESMNFEIRANYAAPLPSQGFQAAVNSGLLWPGNTASRINIQGTPNYLIMKGDSVKADLPYFGERQMSAPYGARDIGITFDGPARDLEVSFDKDKERYNISFSASKKTESYKINLILFPNLNASVWVNSSQRFSIGYQGNVKQIESE
ncbi:DUF4251 domain-containing protein [Robertkochia aurantiaca]|uniref:DUF4251 domain-containing protein n=1 Tax=Robertkochia aurantiaca TaxID=2873700 RepID=UPI002107917D|nr:DUF4251 domain-containing protein [Robertkochia sp. 3YJGBD-33]